VDVSMYINKLMNTTKIIAIGSSGIYHKTA
jgi:hypothetical protein